MSPDKVYDEDVRHTKKVLIYSTVTFALWLLLNYPVILLLVTIGTGAASYFLLKAVLGLL